MPTGLVLFDIDGTIMETGDRHHVDAFRLAFRDVFDIDPDFSGVTRAGMLDAQIARGLFARYDVEPGVGEARLAALMARIGEHYELLRATLPPLTHLLPGVEDAVNAASARHLATGLLTGNTMSVALAKLRLAGVGDLFSFGAFGDAASERGHLVDAALLAATTHTQQTFTSDRTILIGDTPVDIEAARHAGAAIIAVATGRFDLDSLQALEPDAALASLADTDAVANAMDRIMRERW